MSLNLYGNEDTIAAISTAKGEGGIGIIRLSGPKAIEILERIFISASSEASEEGSEKKLLKPRYFYYGHVADPEDGRQIDEAMAVFFKAPHSYTAEDSAEIQVHGSIVSLRNTLELCLREGARLAEKGEFTKRAFLNGRLDLSQAEAVAELVSAKAQKSFDMALSQLNGSVSEKIDALLQKLLDIEVELSVNIDYPDEDIEELSYARLIAELSDIKAEISRLLKASDSARILREGLSVSIIGRPNVGKSSLLNELLGEDRAIVTEIAGTTRDTIEEYAELRGIPLRLIDTAGIRKTKDVVENIGVERSLKAAENAELVILMRDAAMAEAAVNEEDASSFESLETEGKKTILVYNKMDKVKDKGSFVENTASDTLYGKPVFMSLKDGSGLEELKDRIEAAVCGGELRMEERGLSSLRHIELLREALSHISHAVSAAGEREGFDLIEIDVRECFDTLGKITGRTAEAELIDEIFSRFCLGK